MRVMLLADVKGSGRKDDVVEVKDGYARNYLIPKGLAVKATEGVERELTQRKERENRMEAEARRKNQEIAEALRDRVVTVSARVGEAGRLFGAVTNAQIAEALEAMGFAVDRHKITVEPIKQVGDFTAHLRLHAGIDTTVTVRVVAQ